MARENTRIPKNVSNRLICPIHLSLTWGATTWGNSATSNFRGRSYLYFVPLALIHEPQT